MEPLSLIFVRRRLRNWALDIRARYGFPVYLVGSALTKKWPRDIDVRVVMPDDHYAARFGAAKDKNRHWRWADEMGKQNRFAAAQSLLPVDFQVMKKSRAKKYSGQRRVRLDVQRVR